MTSCKFTVADIKHLQQALMAFKYQRGVDRRESPKLMKLFWPSAVLAIKMMDIELTKLNSCDQTAAAGRKRAQWGFSNC